MIAFEGDAVRRRENQHCSDKRFILDRVSTIEAGGATAMYPAMEEAYEALQQTVAKLKHVIMTPDRGGMITVRAVKRAAPAVAGAPEMPSASL